MTDDSAEQWKPLIKTILDVPGAMAGLSSEENMAINVLRLGRNRVRMQVGRRLGNFFQLTAFGVEFDKPDDWSVDAVIQAELAALGEDRSKRTDVFTNDRLTIEAKK